MAVELLNPKALKSLQAESKVELPTDGFLLLVVYEGSSRECEWQSNEVTRELSGAGHRTGRLQDAQATAIWEALVEFQAASDDPATFAASVPPSGAVVTLIGRWPSRRLARFSSSCASQTTSIESRKKTTPRPR